MAAQYFCAESKKCASWHFYRIFNAFWHLSMIHFILFLVNIHRPGENAAPCSTSRIFACHPQESLNFNDARQLTIRAKARIRS
jgi:hypothetical protein